MVMSDSVCSQSVPQPPGSKPDSTDSDESKEKHPLQEHAVQMTAPNDQPDKASSTEPPSPSDGQEASLSKNELSDLQQSVKALNLAPHSAGSTVVPAETTTTSVKQDSQQGPAVSIVSSGPKPRTVC